MRFKPSSTEFKERKGRERREDKKRSRQIRRKQKQKQNKIRVQYNVWLCFSRELKQTYSTKTLWICWTPSPMKRWVPSSHAAMQPCSHIVIAIAIVIVILILIHPIHLSHTYPTLCHTGSHLHRFFLYSINTVLSNVPTAVRCRNSKCSSSRSTKVKRYLQ